MADDKKNIPNAGKADESPKSGKVEPVTADSPVHDQPAPAKAEAPVVEGASKVVTPLVAEKPVEGKTVPDPAAEQPGKDEKQTTIPGMGDPAPLWKGGGFYRCSGWGGEGQAPGKGCGPG